MRILFIGDVVSKVGTQYLMKILPSLKKEENADMVIVNGENSADGNGILPASADDIFTAGADVITSGNHVFRRREIYDYLDTNECILRPSNMNGVTHGRGVLTYDMGKTSVCVVNLMGQVYFQNMRNPFDEIDSILSEVHEKIIFVDFHAETTSEKRAMSFYLDGRVSVLVGTHTHVPTADCQVTKNGLAYITDVGMTGPVESVLGVSPEKAIERLRSCEPVRFTNPQGACGLDGVIIEVSDSTGRAQSIRRVTRREEE